MNRVAQASPSTSLPIVKAYTFKKLVSMIDSLVALDFRGNGIHVMVDHETHTADLECWISPYKKNILTFQIVADGSILVLGNGHSKALSQMDIPTFSTIIESFVKENNCQIN